jgi:hypothetical protein
MITQILLSNERYLSSLNEFFNKLSLKFEICVNIEDFKEQSLIRHPSLFFIQADIESSLDIKNLVGDIRELYGIYVTIVIFGDDMSRTKLSSFVTEGADQFFSFPFDQALMEDFLSKRTQSSFFSAFKYRNIPTRASEVHFNISLEIVELNTSGVIFHGDDLIKNGTIFKLSLNTVNEQLQGEVSLRIVRCEVMESGRFIIYTVFENMDQDVKNIIVNEIRK